jgi:RsiW-degrading membrane proteinase PrsW (M82 family)
MIFLVSVFAAALSTSLYVGLIYWVDRYEKEPLWLLAAAFLWGAIPSIVLAFIVNTVLGVGFYFILGPELGNVAGAAFLAPLVEETLKGMALLGIFFLWRQELDSPLDGIIYGAMVGMGFAMVENVYYFMNVYNEGGVEAWQINIFLRAVIFGLNHALFTSMTGLGIAVARLSRKNLVKFTAPVAGWMAAMFLHFMHNLSASIGGILCLVALFNAWGGVILTLLIIIWALVQEQRWIKKYLEEEVALGTLSPAQYQIACSNLKRFGHRWSLLFSHGPTGYYRAGRFYRNCSELAYKKHHFATLQDSRSQALSEKLRGEIRGLGGQLL